MLPGMVWSFGAGAGIVAGYVVCTSGVDGPASGAASGLVNTTLQVGGVIGIAVFSTIAVGHASSLGRASMAAGNAAAFAGGIVLAVIGVVLALTLARKRA